MFPTILGTVTVQWTFLVNTQYLVYIPTAKIMLGIPDKTVTIDCALKNNYLGILFQYEHCQLKHDSLF